MMDKIGRHREVILLVLLGLISLSLRLGYCRYTNFERDEAAIYESALEFYQSGKLSSVGAEVVYSKTRLPGSLQGLLMGVPLFFSNGLPIGAAYFTAGLNFIAALILFLIYRQWFPRLDRIWLFTFVVFAPWLMVFTKLWNPSFLPVFSALFFWGISILFKNGKSIPGAFCISFSILMTMQLHLSFVLLAALAIGVMVFRLIPIPDWRGLLAGTIFGGFTLAPYLLERFTRTSETSNSFLSSNIVFEPENSIYFLKIFLRFISFATSDTIRFFARGGGVNRTVEAMNLVPLLWPALVVGMLTSVFLIGLGLSFYIKKGNYRLFKRLGSLNAREKMDLLVLVTPFLTCIFFLFSIKGPSAHTFWILVPLSFYPILSAIRDHEGNRWVRVFLSKRFLGGYVFCGLLYSLITPVYSPYVAPLIHAQDIARAVHQVETAGGNASQVLQYDPKYRTGVNAILKVYRSGGF